MRIDLADQEVPIYLHVPPESDLPQIEKRPSKTIVAIDDSVTDEWQNRVSEWIVDSGCLYMMAWGENCSSWDDSVDWVNLSHHDFNDIPEDKFVMTTWHENEPLEEVFWFSKFCANHPTIALDRVIILHISKQNRESEILNSYQWALSDNYLEEK